MTLPSRLGAETAATPHARAGAMPAELCGREWIIDAFGCNPEALRDIVQLGRLFERLTSDLHLTPVAPPVWHTFPAPGGITGFVVLAESHLACHTFPEFGSICVNVFCCRPRANVDAAGVMNEVLGAAHAIVRSVERTYAPADADQA